MRLIHLPGNSDRVAAYQIVAGAILPPTTGGGISPGREVACSSGYPPANRGRRACAGHDLVRSPGEAPPKFWRDVLAFLHRLGACVLLGFLIALPPVHVPHAIAATPMNGWADIAARVLPATVNIQVTKVALGRFSPETGEPTIPGDRDRFVGSGFIVTPTGILVTNKHVIDGALWIIVRLQDGTEVPATVIATSRFVDLALLKVNVGHPLPTLQLGDGDAARPGDPVLAIGDPLGLGTSLSAGIVSGTQRDLMSTPFDDYVQTDATINHGNSGGPLVNTAGEVIGVNTILLTNQPNEGSNGLGFAISSNIVADALRHLLHPNRQPIGWIGLHLQGVTPNLVVALRVPRPGIAIVAEVDADSPASAAGLQPGDVILRYGEQTPPNARILMRDIAMTPIGASRVLRVWSAGQVRQVSLAIRAWPGVDAPSAAAFEEANELPPLSPDLGLLFAPISPLARKAYHLGNVSGVLVAAVDHMSEAYGRGLRRGTVIERIAGQSATTPEVAERLLAEAEQCAPMVALLVRVPQGPIWITLHTGLRPESAAHRPPDSNTSVTQAGSGAPQAAPAGHRQ